MRERYKPRLSNLLYDPGATKELTERIIVVKPSQKTQRPATEKKESLVYVSRASSTSLSTNSIAIKPKIVLMMLCYQGKREEEGKDEEKASLLQLLHVTDYQVEEAPDLRKPEKTRSMCM